MKLRSILSGITALMLVGVFYTFAFCMVEDVDENAISMEYYYSTETEAADISDSDTDKKDADIKNSDSEDVIVEAVDDSNFTEAVPDHVLPAVDEMAETEAESEVKTEITQDEISEETVAVTTAVPEETKEAETVSAAPETKKAEKKEEPFEMVEDTLEADYPEDYEIDEYDDDSSEALEQSVFGEDTNSDKVLSEEETETTTTAAVTTVPETEEPIFSDISSETEVTFDISYDYDDSDDIIITLGGESETVPTETSVSVSVGNGVEISTEETFTAKFDGAIQTVNAYDLICGIVHNEVSTSFNGEAIKAQAVAAYSYVKYHNVNGLTPSVLVKKNVPQRIKDLVSEVWGVCCYHNGSVAQTVYMASSSGYTADAKNVWGGSFPYLKSVYCPFDIDNDPNYGSRIKVSEDNMRTLLENSLGITLSSSPENWIAVMDHIDGNYVNNISIDGQKTITGRKMRENIMGYKLKSAAFEVYYSDGYFVFTTYGYGHGVGMSQNGANILAKQGYSYEEILKYYFTGIEVL